MTSTPGPGRSTPNDAARYVLTLSVASARGQVAGVVTLLGRHHAYIEELAVVDDVLVPRFYVRIVFRLRTGDTAETGTLHKADDFSHESVDTSPTTSGMTGTEPRSKEKRASSFGANPLI